MIDTQLLESKNERNSNNDQKKSINSSNGYSNSNDNQTNGDPFADGKQVDISDSDLPF